MRKDDFIARVLVRLCPEPDKADAAMDRAEALYARYQARGYGPRKPDADEPKPRASVDWLARLDESGRARFMEFWQEYNRVPKPHRATDRNEAASVWVKLSPDAALAERIIAAAKADAARWRESPPAGQTRIYGQGWLNKRRFDGYEAPKASSPAKAEPPQLAKLRDSLKAYEGMQRMKFEPHRAEEIERLRQEISGLEQLSGTN